MTNAANPSQPAGTSSPVDGLTDSAKQAAAQAASQAKEAAGRAFDQAKEQATSHADQQRENVASGMQSVAKAFRSMGDELGNQEQGPVAQYASEMGHAVAGQVEKLSEYLKGRDVHQLIGDAEVFARRSPAVFLGSAFFLGLAASRFLKSSRLASSSPQPAGSANSAGGI